MAKFILGFFVGITLSGICVFGLLISKGRASFIEGRAKGMAIGRAEIAELIEKEFGHHDGSGEYKTLVTVTAKIDSFAGSTIKTNTIVSIETNGVKTVRVVP